jgi:hypothetical protein
MTTATKQKTALKLVIDNVREDRDYRQSTKTARLFTIFTSFDRPGMSDVIGDIMWRRSVSSDKETIALIRKKLPQMLKTFAKKHPHLAESLDLDAAKATVRFSNKAGCTVCPCSPGYVVRVPRLNEPESWHVKRDHARLVTSCACRV